MLARRPRVAAQQRADPGDELVEIEGLVKVVVGAGVEPGNAVRDRVARTDDQHRHCVSARSQGAQQRQAVDVRKAEIEHNGIVHGVRRRSLTLAAVGDPIDGETLLSEAIAHGAADQRVVLDQEQAHRGFRHQRSKPLPRSGDPTDIAKCEVRIAS